ncbi:hypothetical protein TNCV_1286801 [Trichonephila clavipes]|nr:hypothetical protein TNCV_1286801 [Trichonephila clavipes]
MFINAAIRRNTKPVDDRSRKFEPYSRDAADRRGDTPSPPLATNFQTMTMERLKTSTNLKPFTWQVISSAKARGHDLEP